MQKITSSPSYNLESTDADPRLLYRGPTQRPASNSPTLPFSFLFYSRQLSQIHANLGQNGLIRANSGRNKNRYGRNGHRNMPIPAETGWFQPKQAEMGSSCHSSASCGLVRGGGEKKKKEKEEEDEKTKKMDGRRIKVCNKRI